MMQDRPVEQKSAFTTLGKKNANPVAFERPALSSLQTDQPKRKVILCKHLAPTSDATQIVFLIATNLRQTAPLDLKNFT